VLLDTTVLIDYLRGRPAVLERFRALAHPPLICAVTAEEIWRGARIEEESATANLLEALRIAPLGLPEGERAGKWRRRFAAEGTTLHQADCLIAAAAVGAGARLATANPDDFPMDELEVEHWPTIA
jgi:predicted nucleic acid-binding protein